MAVQLKPESLNLLRVIAGNAGADSSKTLSKWFHGEVTLKMEKVEMIPFEQVVSKAGPPDSISIALFTHIEKGVEGSLLSVMSEKTAFELVDLLIRKPLGTTKQLGKMEHSALLETANIVGCAYLNSLRHSISVDMIPGPPLLLHDLTQSIMDSILMEQAAYQEEALLIEAEFYHAQGKFDWCFFFLPVLVSLQELLEKKNAS